MEFTDKDLSELGSAKALLENPSMAARVTHLIGAPIEKGLELLPQKWAEIVNRSTRISLGKALDFAVLTMNKDPADKKAPLTGTHKWIVASTGAVGGAFGLLSLPLELPVSTVVMLRSIADIAKSEGEDLALLETRLACLEVFALGGRSPRDDAVETGYFTVRAALARAVTEASRFIAQKGLAQKGAPAMVRLITAIGSRFSMVVSQKIALQAVPFMGAAGGALINTLFMDHFQDMARGHFTIRRMERVHGTEKVRLMYEGL
jgi:hypothetical protein